MCVDAKTHVTVSVPTLAVCLMLSESEAEHARLTVLGANVRVCVCERGEELGVRGQGREEDTKAKGKAAIKAQSAHPLPPISV